MTRLTKRTILTFAFFATAVILSIQVAFAIPEPFSEKHIMSGLISDWIDDMFMGKTVGDIKNLLYIDFDTIKDGTVTVAGKVGKTGTVSQSIAMVTESGDYITAGFWVAIVLLLAFLSVFNINMIKGKHMKNVKSW